jgi:hypothetical protein
MNRRTRWRGSLLVDQRVRWALGGLLLLVLAGVSWALYAGIGPVALVLVAPAWGFLLSRPLMALLGAFKQQAQAAAMAPIDGHLYQYKGRWMAVAEDEADERWLRAEHVRQVVPGLPADDRLLHLLGDTGCRRFQGVGSLPGLKDKALYVHDAALLQLLARAQQDDTVRFKVWVEREVQRPGALRRARQGGA